MGAVRFAVGFDTEPLLQSFSQGSEGVLSMLGAFQKIAEGQVGAVDAQLKSTLGDIHSGLQSLASILHERGVESLGVLDSLAGREAFAKDYAKRMGRDITLLSQAEIKDLYEEARAQQVKLSNNLERVTSQAREFEDSFKRAAVSSREIADDMDGTSERGGFGGRRGGSHGRGVGEESPTDKLIRAIQDLPDKIAKSSPWMAALAADQDYYKAKRLNVEGGMSEAEVKKLVGPVARSLQAEKGFLYDNDLYQQLLRDLVIIGDRRNLADIEAAGRVGMMLHTALGVAAPEAISTLNTLNRDLKISFDKAPEMLATAQKLAQQTTKSSAEIMKGMVESADYVRRLSREERMGTMQEIAATVAAFDQAGQSLRTSEVTDMLKKFSAGAYGGRDSAIATAKMASFLGISSEQLSQMSMAGKSTEIYDMITERIMGRLGGLERESHEFRSQVFQMIPQLSGLKSDDVFKFLEVGESRARGEAKTGGQLKTETVLTGAEPAEPIEDALTTSTKRWANMTGALFRDMGSTIQRIVDGPLQKFSDLSTSLAQQWLNAPQGVRDTANVLSSIALMYFGKDIGKAVMWPLKKLFAAGGVQKATTALGKLFGLGATPAATTTAATTARMAKSTGDLSRSLMGMTPKIVTASSKLSTFGRIVSGFRWGSLLTGMKWLGKASGVGIVIGLIGEAVIGFGKSLWEAGGKTDGFIGRAKRVKNVLEGLGVAIWEKLGKAFKWVVDDWKKGLAELKGHWETFTTWITGAFDKYLGPLWEKVSSLYKIVTKPLKGAADWVSERVVAGFDATMDSLSGFEKVGADRSAARAAARNTPATVEQGTTPPNLATSLGRPMGDLSGIRGGKWWDTIQQHSHIDPMLAMAMMQQESGGDPNAVSGAGARGLFQIMPGTGKDLGLHKDQDFFDPAKSTEAGTRYFKQLLQQFGSVEVALAAYNAGPNSKAVRRYAQTGDLSVLPKETQAYVPKIMGRYADIQDKLGGEGFGADQIASLRETTSGLEQTEVVEAVRSTGGTQANLLEQILAVLTTTVAANPVSNTFQRSAFAEATDSIAAFGR